MTTAFESIAKLIDSNELEAAAEQLRGVSPSNNEERVEKYYLEGYLSERRDAWTNAVASYRLALEADPDHSETMFRLAYILDIHGDDEEAMALYEKCVAEAPAHVNAMMNLAVLYEDHGKYDEAIGLLGRIVDEHPNHLRARLFYADVESSLTMYYDEDRERTREQHDAVLDIPVSDFELSVRSRNCLKQMNINHLGDLLRITEPKLLAYKNFGETSLNEIKAMLAQKGLRLGQLIEERPAAAAAPSGHQPLLTAGDANLLNRNVAELELSVRSRKCLQRLGVLTLTDLIQHSEPELLSIKNFGQTSLDEIKKRLAELGLSLRQPN
ncbi:MAG: tetratricopeptide repeat protein [Phycisphaerae bacterium]|nr:tetratricopeptide repeat protein [Phycisphaerales bacterium]